MNFSQWISREAKETEVLAYIAFVFFAGYVYQLTGIMICKVMNVTLPVGHYSLSLLSINTFVVVTITMLVEEILFRLPLAIFIYSDCSVGITLVGALLLSVLFGICHGKPLNIAFQGIDGFLYSILFLKCGGFQRKFVKAISVTFVTHFLHNSALIIFLVANGCTEI